MGKDYEIIDMATWSRAVHCQVFREALQPHYDVSLELDITNFYRMVKEKELSLTLSLIYAVTRCANEIEAFRCRFLDGNVVIYPTIHTSFTYIEPGDELFKVVNASMKDSLEDYVRSASALAKAQKEYFTGPMANDVYQFSALPWIAYTHVSHTESGKKDMAQPIFVWGRFSRREGKLWMPFSVHVHHSFVDGIHIGWLVEKLQDYLNKS